MPALSALNLLTPAPVDGGLGRPLDRDDWIKLLLDQGFTKYDLSFTTHHEDEVNDPSYGCLPRCLPQPSPHNLTGNRAEAITNLAKGVGVSSEAPFTFRTK